MSKGGDAPPSATPARARAPEAQFHPSPLSSLCPFYALSLARSLQELKSKVGDLCDLQPTPASMLRPARKDMLKDLRNELAAALQDVETELDEMGGSVTAKSVASTAVTGRSVAASAVSADAASSKGSKAPSVAPSVTGSMRSIRE